MFPVRVQGLLVQVRDENGVPIGSYEWPPIVANVPWITSRFTFSTCAATEDTLRLQLLNNLFFFKLNE